MTQLENQSRKGPAGKAPFSCGGPVRASVVLAPGPLEVRHPGTGGTFLPSRGSCPPGRRHPGAAARFAYPGRSGRRGLLPFQVLVLLLVTMAARAEKIGIFLGTFDPPHAGHLNVARLAIEKLGLDRLYLVPNFSPGHKPGATSFERRYDLVRLVTLHQTRIETLPQDWFPAAWKQAGPDYNAVLIDRIRARHGPAARYYQVCGSDSFARMITDGRLPTPDENRILAVFERKGTPKDSPRVFREEGGGRQAGLPETDTRTPLPGLPQEGGSGPPIDPVVERLRKAGRILFLDEGPGEPRSSTRFRSSFAAGNRPAPEDVPGYISRYVSRHGLYGFPRRPVRWSDLLAGLPRGYRAVLPVAGPNASPPGMPSVREGRGSTPDFTEVPLPGRAPVASRSWPGYRTGLSAAGPLDPGETASGTFAGGREAEPPGCLFSADLLRAPLTLDVEAYLRERLPEAVFRLTEADRFEIRLVAGLPGPALGWLAASGFHPLFGLVPTGEFSDEQYWFGKQHGTRVLVVTNIFGEDRLFHLALQYANLLARDLIPPDRLRVFRPAGFANLSATLCNASLQGLQGTTADTVVIGYRASLNFVMSDLHTWISHHRGESLARLDFRQFARIKDGSPRRILRPAAQGNVYFPWWEYRLPGRDLRHRFIAFRNIYGDAVRDLVENLCRRGFRRFVMFGNAGGLSERVHAESLYAPVEAGFGTETVRLANAAVKDYPGRRVLKVRSILEETEGWLARTPSRSARLHTTSPASVSEVPLQAGRFGEVSDPRPPRPNRAWDLVDVENFDAGLALVDRPGVALRSVLLVSDLPGKKDITRRDENSRQAIEAKEAVFFQAIMEALGTTQSGMRPRRPVSPSVIPPRDPLATNPVR